MGVDRGTRREVLVRGALAIQVALAGCLWGDSTGEDDDWSPPASPGDDSPPAGTDDSSSTPGEATPRSTTDDSSHPTATDEPATETPTDRPPGATLVSGTAYQETTAQVLDGGIGGDSRIDHYATVMTSEAATDRFDETALDEEVVTFVERTRFPEEILLVVQRDLHSISHDLDLAWAAVDDRTLAARVDVIHHDVFSASTNATLVARLDLDDQPIPEGGTVTVVDEDGYATVVEVD